MLSDRIAAVPPESQSVVDRLVARIASHDFTIGIIGLGYVGIPLALTACKAGFRVIGFEIDAARVEQVNRGESFIRHVPAVAIVEALRDGRLSATADFERLREADAVLITVPTPLSKNREPDLSFVEDAARAIAPRLRAGQLIVLESTTWPGTTDEIVKRELEASGARSGQDFFLGYSPEREDPGNLDFSTSNTPKIVGGDGAEALRLIEALYRALVVQTVPVSSVATAEAVKLTENIFRSVNIALVNELKVIYTKMGIDVWEVIDAAKTKPFGFMPFFPGPGLGGHCIPIDPFYLTWKAREFDVTTKFVELAGQINSAMPQYVVDRLTEALDRHQGRGLRDTRVLVLGIAYKKNVDDVRESPALKLIELLEDRSARVDFHDPHAAVIPMTRDYAALAGRRSVTLDDERVRGYHVVLIATDHDVIDYAHLVRTAKLVVDTRNACARAGALAPHVVKA